ncbi:MULTISPECIES: low molecular weight phosphatase family protein [unclassified Variovorax]|uniref:arsenate-mycothiol transferase ArsC n=1 Tax=unclassified Variovorax TaxID=663243 RepID=UPI001BD4CD25|nr:MULTISPECIES: protein tyrosine phosphatase [unclassified Variovorax]
MATRIVFVSKRNSLRSVLAQAVLAHIAGDRFSAVSCGNPKHVGESVHPAAVWALSTVGIAVPQVPPRGWNDLARAGGPRVDFVITLDEATQLLEPSWPGQPYSALWTFPDAAAADDAERAAHIALQILYGLRRRLELFTSLPLQGADPAAIRSDIRDLGYMG